MEVGIPMSLQSPAAGFGELVFNDFSGSATALGGGSPYPGNRGPLGAGCGYFVEKISGFDGAPIRNPVDNRPHKSGGIVHTFRRAAKVWTIEGKIMVPDNVTGVEERYTRGVLEDAIRGYSDSIMARTGRYFFRPSGQLTRFQECRLYEPVDIGYDSISGPKNFAVTLVSQDPRAYTFTQDVTEITLGDTIPLPNLGNTESWPVIKVNGPCSGFSVIAGTGFFIGWAGDLNAGAYIEIDMFKETMYGNGDGPNRLGGLDLETSDFWSIPPGGTTLTLVGAPSATVLSNSAWV